MVLSSGVHTLLGKEAGPGKRHQTTQLGSLAFVVGVVDVWGGMFYEKGGKLEKKDTD